MTQSARKTETEPKLVDQTFLPNGDQVCIWSDGAAFLLNKEKGEKPIGIRKARRLIAEVREKQQYHDDRGYAPDEDGALGYIEDD